MPDVLQNSLVEFRDLIEKVDHNNIIYTKINENMNGILTSCSSITDETALAERESLLAANRTKRNTQALCVIMNESLVRAFYFIRKLTRELKAHSTPDAIDWNKINWKKTIPFNDRTINNLLLVSQMTFAAVDLSDAAIRAAIESAGHFVIFASRFSSHLNMVNAKRLAISAYFELSASQQEEQLAHERRLLIEAHCEEAVQAITRFRESLRLQLEKFFSQMLQAFLQGTNLIEQNIASNDLDLFMNGNITIQRVLGRTPQFNTKDEFDRLMTSSEDFKL